MWFRCVRVDSVLRDETNRLANVWTSPWVLFADKSSFDLAFTTYNIPAFTLPEKGDSDYRAWSHCENVFFADSCIALNNMTFNTDGDKCTFELFHQDNANGDGGQGKHSLGTHSILKTGIGAPTTSTVLVIGSKPTPRSSTSSPSFSNSSTIVSSSNTSAENATTFGEVPVVDSPSVSGMPELPLALIIGVSLAGVGVFALFLAVTVICITRRRRRRQAKQPKTQKKSSTPTPKSGVMSANDSQEFLSMRGGGDVNQQRLSYAPSYGYGQQQQHQQQQQQYQQDQQYHHHHHPQQYQNQPPILLPVDGDIMVTRFVTSQDLHADDMTTQDESAHSRRKHNGDSKRVHKKRSGRSGRQHDNRSHVSIAEAQAAEDTAEAEELRGIDSNHVIDYAELEMLNELGSGSFGVVWRAKWRNMDVAVKEVLGESGKASLISEVAKMQHLRRHPNICSYYGCTKRPLALVVEFCNGGALDERALALNSKQQTGIAIGIASGVRHLHLELVVHRDLAARNILLEVDGEKIVPKVADFGMARVSTGLTNQTKTDVGPLKWMAPEQLATLQYSEKSDVWSFGVVLFEMYACDVPWADISPPMAAHKIVSGELLPIDPTWPSEVQEVMRRCWEYEPTARPRMTAIYDSLIALRRSK
jgi:predicted Ser/Thr protein kinase